MAVIELLSGLRRVDSVVNFSNRTHEMIITTTSGELFGGKKLGNIQMESFSNPMEAAPKIGERLFRYLFPGLLLCTSGIASATAPLSSELSNYFSKDGSSEIVIAAGLLTFRAGMEMIHKFRMEKSKYEAVAHLFGY